MEEGEQLGALICSDEFLLGLAEFHYFGSLKKYSVIWN